VGSAGIKLVKGMHHLYAAKGKKVVHVDLRTESPSKAELTKLMVGPSGNLRAPTLRIGKTLVVGFNDEMYDTVLG
jgi:arsenate reductase-like glutaredoxin family protein